jgi:CBS domain-containing membrane protein
MSGASSESNDTPTAQDGEGEAKAEASPEVIEIEPGPGEPPPVPRAKPASSVAVPLSVANLPPRASPPRTVGDLMTRKVIALHEDEPLGDLEGGMARFSFRHLPVVSADSKLVGLITRTDFLHAALGIAPNGKPMEKADAGTPARAVMNKNVVTARIDAPLVTALEVMLHEKLGCLPVVLEDNTLVGIVTETDFNRLALELLER